MHFKVVFDGPTKSRKTSTVYNLLGYRSLPKPTLGVEVHPYSIYNIWDISGDPKRRGLADGYYIDAQIVILFGNSEEFLKDATRFAPKAKIINVAIGTKPAIIKALLDNAVRELSLGVESVFKEKQQELESNLTQLREFMIQSSKELEASLFDAKAEGTREEIVQRVKEELLARYEEQKSLATQQFDRLFEEIRVGINDIVL